MENLCKNRMCGKSTAIFSLGVVVLVLYVSVVYYGANLYYIALFALFNIIYIQFPGLFFLKSIKIHYTDVLKKFLIAFFCGMTILIAQYYLLSFLHLFFLIKYINIVVSVFFIVQSIRKKHKGLLLIIKTYGERSINAITVLYFLCIFLYFMLNLQFQYVDPSLSKFVSVGQDYMWEMGNINSLANYFPPVDFRVAGFLFYYHYFQDLFYGICLNIFKIPADVLMFSCSPYLLTYIFGGGLLLLFRTFCRKKRNAELYGLGFIVSNLCMTNIIVADAGKHSSWINDHIFMNINSVGFSISAIVLLIVALEDCRGKNHVIVTMCLMFIATGLKGPMAAVIIAGIFVALIIESAVKRKINKYHLSVFVGNVMMFGIVYLFVISGVQYGTAPKGSDLEFSITSTIQYTAIYKNIFVNSDYNQLIYYFLIISVIFITMVFACGSLSFPYLIYFYYKGKQLIFNKESFSWNEAIRYVSIFIGIGGFLIVGQSGKSQGYFLFAILPLMFLEVMCMIEKRKEYKVIVQRVILITFCVGLLWGCVNFMKDMHQLIDTAIYRVTHCMDEAETEYSVLLKEEYEGLLWMRENTKEDAIVATDHRNLTISDPFEITDNLYYYNSAYSQRLMYLDGHRYAKKVPLKETERRLNILKQIYDTNNNMRAQIARENGIDYVIVTHTVHPNLNLSNEGMKLCFINDKIRIYQVIAN